MPKARIIALSLTVSLACDSALNQLTGGVGLSEGKTR